MNAVPSLSRMLERLEILVSAETPSGDAERLLACYEPLSQWGADALDRAPETLTSDGVPHLYWPAVEAPATLLLMHADTVFAAGTTTERPFRVHDDRATGPGVFDMKAGIVLALEALGAVAEPGNVALLVTGDEEVGSPTSRPIIEKAAAGARATLIPEPSLDGALKTARKGGGIYQIEFEGREAHAGLEPERGHNALVELAHLTTRACALSDTSVGTTVTPTTARAGTTTNTVPAYARIGIDVRAWSLDELVRVDTALREMPARNTDVRIRLDGGINRPPLEESASAELFAVARDIAVSAALPEPQQCAVGGASDGNFTAAMGVPTLDGLGAVGDGAHASTEWIDLPSLTDRARLLGSILAEITRSG